MNSDIKKELQEEVGKAFKELRRLKGLTQGELGNRKIISDYENGKKGISFSETLILLDTLNATADELIHYIDDENFSVRERLSWEMSNYIGRKNIEGLTKIKNQAAYYYQEHGSEFFKHHIAMSEANIIIHQTTNDYEKARREISSIRTYLADLKHFFYNDLILLAQCLFIFDIDTSIKLVEKGLQFIKNDYDFYKHRKIGASLALNAALYALDFPNYVHFSLEYANFASKLAIAQSDLKLDLMSKAIAEIAAFKVGNGTFNQEALKSYLTIYKTMEWHTNYDSLKSFIQKQGINL